MDVLQVGGGARDEVEMVPLGRTLLETVEEEGDGEYVAMDLPGRVSEKKKKGGRKIRK